MSINVDELRDDRLNAAVQLCRTARLDVPPEVAARVVKQYFRHVPPDDVAQRSPEDLLGAVLAHLRLAAQRPQGVAVVQVLTPGEGAARPADGWSAEGHSVVQVVTDDMAFLVDSLTMELVRLGCTVHLVVHPQVRVVRDVGGALVEIHERGSSEPVPSGDERVTEAWIHIEIDRVVDQQRATEIRDAVLRVLRDVRDAVDDWDRMAERVTQTVHDLGEQSLPVPDDEVDQARAFLSWLATDHFTFLGYREYQLTSDGTHEMLRAVPGSGLGLLRADPDLSDPAYGRLRGEVAQRARDPHLLVLTKANARSTVHRRTQLDYVGVKTFDDSGAVVGERRFLGLYTGAANRESVTRIPLLREKAAQVLEAEGLEASSHAGKALMDTLETYPRDELFHTPAEDLARIARDVTVAMERRRLRAFLRTDPYQRYVSVLVYLPREQYNTAVRERMAALLAERLGGEHVEFTVRLGESSTARVSFVVHPPKGVAPPPFDAAALERELVAAARSWRDAFVDAVVAASGADDGARLAAEWADSFEEGYKEDFTPEAGARDVLRLAALTPEHHLDLRVDMEPDQGRGDWQLKVYRLGESMALSTALPMIASLGVEVVDEWPYEFGGRPDRTWLFEFGLRGQAFGTPRTRELVEEALRAIWAGECEVDGFNALVLAAGLSWREVWVLRAYAKYMLQGRSPFSQGTIEKALRDNAGIAGQVVQLFRVRFDPDLYPDDEAGRRSRHADSDDATRQIEKALEQVSSLDEDRILRSYLTLLNATLRTNHYRTDRPSGAAPVLALKLEPTAIPDLPEPRPRFEVFVHSPRVEGVHLRFGSVARGGLRWSDRRDDFRTEVLGLVKAQMVKNTVIVPVGAKGGFFPKQLPPATDRDAWLAEGKACYRAFISGLLDLTDNRAGAETVPPERVVRHDGDDSYLVVAADKGTASFSDIANQVADDYGFWLGDAFASGGSVGYDHKSMGITARGAWVSVRRHFRERGVDTQNEDFTCVGIGDMSGDVFGNGMLSSEHIRLVAAFDHRDIFLDPDPDAAASYAERRRLFDLPRSSWADYDRTLISDGGGVHSRSSKSIPLTPQVRAALGLGDDVVRLTPNELIRAVLTAPVDLLWNGGIGTYVKGSEEQHSDVGDKANDGIRVNGADLRTHCVGEGGNLGFTQLGRIEYALAGGRINTDAIDNSAGVDTSDHEVNIKILLQGVVASGALDQTGRNKMLLDMTDEVAALVLRDNYEQNLALANATEYAAALAPVHEYWMKHLERRGVLNRSLEALPSTARLAARAERGGGLTVPELAVLLAWTKIVMADELLDSDLPEDPFLRGTLFGYFPSPMRSSMRGAMEAHPLHRELVVTQVVNDVVNSAGITYWPRVSGETGAPLADLVRANVVARELFGAAAFRSDLDAQDNLVPAAVQTRMRVDLRTLCEQGARWLLTRNSSPLACEEIVDFHDVRVQQLIQRLPSVLVGAELVAYEARRDALVSDGAPEDLAARAAAFPPSRHVLGIVETADAAGVEPLEVARLHFGVAEVLGLHLLVARVSDLPRKDRWQNMARATLRDDLLGTHAELTRQVLTSGPELSGTDGVEARLRAWQESEPRIATAVSILQETCRDDSVDLSRLSVAVRVVRSLVARAGQVWGVG